MRTTCEFLDAVKARHHLPSDYAVAAKLGITRSAVSSYRNGKSYFDDSTAIKAAELLEMDPSIVAAVAHSERAKTAQEKAMWQSMVEKLGGLAASVLMGVSLLFAPAPAEALAFDNNAETGLFMRHSDNTLHIMRHAKRQPAEFGSAVFAHQIGKTVHSLVRCVSLRTLRIPAGTPPSAYVRLPRRAPRLCDLLCPSGPCRRRRR